MNGCNANESTECMAQVGGLFNETASKTWTPVKNSSTMSSAIENPSADPNHATDLWGSDVLGVTPQTSLDSYLMRVSRGPGETMNTLGLGRNSTLLNELVDGGLISSKTWGFWQGWTGAESINQIDGSLILGGYDADKTTGPNYTFPTSTEDSFTADCYLVTVIDIKMNFENGTSLSLWGPSKSKEEKACVLPHFEVLSLPEDVWDLFLELSGSTYIGRSVSPLAFYGMLVDQSRA